MDYAKKQIVVDYFPTNIGQYENEELYLTNSGIQNCRPGHFYGPSTRGNYFLHFIIKGKGSLEIDAQKYNLSKGDIFLISSNQKAFYKADDSEPWQYGWVAFNGVEVENVLNYAGFGHDMPVQHSQISNKTYLEIIEDIVQERETTLANMFTRTSQLYKLFSVLVEAQHLEGRLGKPIYDYPHETYVEYAKDFIALRYACVSVSDVAEYVGATRSHLTMIFNKVLGVSPQQYLLQFRLDKAQKLLTTTSLPLREIARKVGYKDPFTFSKMFKAKFGISPSEFRNQNISSAI